MKLKRIHHVAYRCKDAKETVEFYQRVLNMDFTVAFAEDQVPSTKEPDPYMHVFLDCGAGNVLAFFELPTRPEMDRDHNTPEWVQHIAFEVDDYDALLAAAWHRRCLKNGAGPRKLRATQPGCTNSNSQARNR
jgi:catechol 2,3-dioxygenase-like lactoylglutathione lyase family enzyme